MVAISICAKAYLSAWWFSQDLFRQALKIEIYDGDGEKNGVPREKVSCASEIMAGDTVEVGFIGNCDRCGLCVIYL